MFIPINIASNLHLEHKAKRMNSESRSQSRSIFTTLLDTFACSVTRMKVNVSES